MGKNISKASDSLNILALASFLVKPPQPGDEVLLVVALWDPAALPGLQLVRVDN